MTSPRPGVEGADARRTAVHGGSPWRVAWRACGAGFLFFWVLAVGPAALTAGPGVASSTAVGVLWSAGIPAVLVGVPGAALVTALLAARPVLVQVAVFAAGGLLGALLLPSWGSTPSSVVAAVGGAAGGRAWVAWRDSRRPDVDGSAVQESADRTDDWRSPLVWLAATLGLLLLPAWAGFAAMISAASFFGEPGDPSAAVPFLWAGAIGAAVSTVVVCLVGARGGRRGGPVAGSVPLALWGGLVTLLLALVAISPT